MDGGKDILTDNSLGEYNSILKVISLPRHICNLKVSSKSKLSILGCISVCHYLTRLNLIAPLDNRSEKDRGALVGLAVERKLVDCNFRVEAYKLLILCALVFYVYLVGINIYNFTLACCGNLCSGVSCNRTLKACSNNRSLRFEYRHCLTHHV